LGQNNQALCTFLLDKLNQGPLIPGKISVSFPNLTPPPKIKKERKKLKNPNCEV